MILNSESGQSYQNSASKSSPFRRKKKENQLNPVFAVKNTISKSKANKFNVRFQQEKKKKSKTRMHVLYIIYTNTIHQCKRISLIYIDTYIYIYVCKQEMGYYIWKKLRRVSKKIAPWWELKQEKELEEDLKEKWERDNGGYL